MLIDGAQTVWDSLAIVEYLAERHPHVWPEAAAARAWARSAAAEMHAGFVTLRNLCPMSCGVRVRLTQLPPALKRDIARLDALWQDGLSTFGGPWLAGPAFSAVDAFYAPVVFRAQSFGLALSAPAQAWCERIRRCRRCSFGISKRWRKPGATPTMNRKCWPAASWSTISARRGRTERRA